MHVNPASSSTSNSGEDYGTPNLEGVYGELLGAIRTTDEISFKLLGFVPLVSGVASGGLSVFLPGENPLHFIPVVLLAMLGTAVTRCLFLWEQRNIQTCNHLWRKLEFVESRLGFRELAGRLDAPCIRGRRWGKTESEAWIYRLAGISWLVPVVTGAVKLVASQ